MYNTQSKLINLNVVFDLIRHYSCYWHYDSNVCIYLFIYNKTSWQLEI